MVTITGTKYSTATEVTSDKDISLKVDETSQITAILNPDVGGFEYSSDNVSVVTVSDSGLITVVGAGTAVITVSYPGDGRKYEASSDTVTVTVTKYATATEVTSSKEIIA